MMESLGRQMQSQLTGTVLPGIRSKMVQYQPGGSSRGDLVQSQAISSANQQMLNKAAEMLNDKGLLLDNINEQNLKNSIHNLILNADLLKRYQNKSWDKYKYNQTAISILQDKIRNQIFNSYYK